MARASRSGFAKREKERARFEKRQSKLARRQQKGKGEEGVPDPDAADQPATDEEEGGLDQPTEGQETS